MNPFRFSTKYQDNESDLIYYGYRYYDPSPARWLNRDIVEELGGINLFALSHNDGINQVDYLGLDASAFYLDWYNNGYDAAEQRLKIYLVLTAAAYKTELEGRPMTSRFLFNYLEGYGRPLVLRESFSVK